MYAVWSSQLGAEEHDVPRAADLLPDPRARHYWDPEQAVGGPFAGVLGMDSPAWDVWLLFDRDARWRDLDAPPDPAWWAHQLNGLPDSLRLDPDRFARKGNDLLDR